MSESLEGSPSEHRAVYRPAPRPARDTDRHAERQAVLRYLLNQWDPIGVADVVDDEYDCLLGPLWTLLSQHPARAEVSEHLWHEVEDHLGLDPRNHDVDRFADLLTAWAATR